jgi:hypothetical protein
MILEVGMRAGFVEILFRRRGLEGFQAAGSHIKAARCIAHSVAVHTVAGGRANANSRQSARQSPIPAMHADCNDV